MRDYFIIFLVFLAIPIALFSPWKGILFYHWISLMNPHRLTWGVAKQFPVAKYISIAILLGYLFSKEKKFDNSLNIVFILIILFMIHFSLTTITAFNKTFAWIDWQKKIKIFIMIIVSIQLINTPMRFKLLMLVITFSIGFYGIKGGIFAIITGGNYRVWGPPDTFIADNNDLGLALNMILPFFFFRAVYQKIKYFKATYFILFTLTLLAIISTHSRGAFIGLVAVLLAIAIFLDGLKKIIGILIVILSSALIIHFAPDKWFERMETIKSYQQDGSAMGRINAWKFAINVAKDYPITGGGFGVFKPEFFWQYAPDPFDYHDAHSIYFEVLGEQGFVGLLLFLGIIIISLYKLFKIRQLTLKFKTVQWALPYTSMLVCSIIAYLVNGLTLGLAYFDLFWLIVGMVVSLEFIIKKSITDSILLIMKKSRDIGKDTIVN